MRKISIIFFIFLCFAISAHAETEDAVFAVLKLSYNTPGETPVTGGICGTAFLINEKAALTAHHVLNKTTGPNHGFKRYQLWLLKRGDTKLAIPIKSNSFKCFPEIESTVICLTTLPSSIERIQLSPNDAQIGTEVFSIGHVGGGMPVINATWVNDILDIHSYSLPDSVKSDKSGVIVDKKPKSIRTEDVNLVNIVVLQPSFGAIKGMSGGPLLTKNNNKIVGLMSFGLPVNASTKNVVFAISIDEIIRKFNSANVKF